MAKLILQFPPKSLPACLFNFSGSEGRGGYNNILRISEARGDLHAFQSWLSLLLVSLLVGWIGAVSGGDQGKLWESSWAQTGGCGPGRGG